MKKQRARIRMVLDRRTLRPLSTALLRQAVGGDGFTSISFFAGINGGPGVANCGADGGGEDPQHAENP